jgi:5'-nucleotidase
VPRILVTNDDGIAADGLAALARAATALGDVVVVAPDREQSGASAAIGPLHLVRPEVRRSQMAGVPEAWTVAGPPALAVYLGCLGAFGPPFDLILSGINAGANVGRSVLHSGTVGAALTGSAEGVPAIAVSQVVSGLSVLGQGDGPQPAQALASAATLAVALARAVLAQPPGSVVALNLNVPNLTLDQLAGWEACRVAASPDRDLADAQLLPLPDDPDGFQPKLSWGTLAPPEPGTDVRALREGLVTLTALAPPGVALRPIPDACARALDEVLVTPPRLRSQG